MRESIFVGVLAAAVLATAGATALSQGGDSDEPNDTAEEASVVGRVGFACTGRALPVDDQDWYRFEVVKPGSRVSVELDFDSGAYDTVLSLTVTSLTGTPIASGSAVADAGRYSAVTGPLAVGEYLIQVAYVGGSDLPEYSIRTFAQNDSDEPNDTAGAATAVGNVGLVRPSRVLNFNDVDWYRFDVPAASGPVTIDVGYNTLAYDASVALDVQTLAGSPVASGTYVGDGGPLRAVTGSLSAGSYVARVAHRGGAAVSDYTLQISTPLTLATPMNVETSVGVQLDLPADIAGGVKPYTLSVDSGSVAPAGLILDADAGRIRGTVAVAGRYSFLVNCRDSGSPTSTVSRLITIVANPRLKLRSGEFTAFAAGKSAARAIPSIGGTAPFDAVTTVGDLPNGVSLASSQIAFVGTADGMLGNPSGAVSIQVTDASGLTDTATTTCVVCAPMGTVSLGAERSATGVYFDAVKGSVVSVRVATAKRETKRALRAVLLGSDGTTPVEATVRGGNGAAALSRFVAPSSGRFYLILASESGAASNLVATATIALPTRGTARVVAPSAGDPARIEVGVVSGASLRFAAKPKERGLELRVRGLIDPSGVPVPVDATTVKMTAGSVEFTRVLDQSGTWTILVDALRGGPGSANVTYQLKQPKAAAYSAGE